MNIEREYRKGLTELKPHVEAEVLVIKYEIHRMEAAERSTWFGSGVRISISGCEGRAVM